MENPLTIVQINALGKTTSTGRTTREMHEYFIENGYNSYIATACNKDCSDGFAISNMHAMHFDVLLTLITGKEADHSFIPTQRFLRFLDRVKPDIVHLRILHNSYINFYQLLDYLAKHDIATVITLHDMWMITGHCCHYLSFGCNKWITGCYDCPELKTLKRKPLFDRTKWMWNKKYSGFKQIKRLAVVGNSEWTTNEARKSIVKDVSVVKCIYNWIDFSKFYPREQTIIRNRYGLMNKIILLGVSVFWSENDKKGFNAFLELAKELDNDYSIILIGQINYLKEIPSNIICVGTITDAEILADYYSEADIFLNLSEAETFGKAAAEAICCGTPVIALNNTANPEIVPPGAGCLVESSEVNSLKCAISQIVIHDKDYYRKICIEYARERFDKEKNIKQYIHLYKSLVEYET